MAEWRKLEIEIEGVLVARLAGDAVYLARPFLFPFLRLSSRSIGINLNLSARICYIPLAG